MLVRGLPTLPQKMSYSHEKTLLLLFVMNKIFWFFIFQNSLCRDNITDHQQAKNHPY